MFDLQSGIRIVAFATSVVLLNHAAFGDEIPFQDGFPVERALPPAEQNSGVEVMPEAPPEREARIFSSGPVEGARAPAATMEKAEVIPAPMRKPAESTPKPKPELAIPAIPAVVTPPSETASVPMAIPEVTTMDHYYTQEYHSAPVYCQHQPLAHNWFSAESLIWWTSQPDVPVIATTSPAGTPGLQAGILGQPQTSELWGGGDLFDLTRGGVRLRAGQWFDGDDGSGIQAEFLMLGSAGHNFSGSSNGNPIIARPFVNQDTGLPDAQLIAFPGLSTGTLNFNAETRMYSVGFNYWAELIAEYDDDCGESSQGSGCQSGCNCRQSERIFGLKLGPRFIHHDDTILADERLAGLASGNQFRILDSFKTENSFLGGEIGLRAQRNRGNYSMDLGLNLGIGATRQELDVSGLTTITTPAGIATTTPGGFLAQSTNSGSWDDTTFSLVPSLEFELGMEVGNGWKFAVGYDFMYWTNVLRAAEQIDTVIHPDLFPPAVNPTTASRPGPILSESDYFAHGISVSIERRW